MRFEVHQRGLSSFQPPKEFHLPAPVGGLDSVTPASQMDARNCLVSYNLVPGQYGLQVRTGYREWCTGVVGIADNTVRSILPFRGSVSGNDKLFACTSKGIYDVTSSSATPTLVHTFGTQSGNAGWGESAVAVTSAGHFLLYTDEVNGYHVYSESAGTWAAITQGAGGTQIDNVDPADFVSVHVYKNRVFFTERDSDSVWYLAAGSIYGAATEFPLGRQFKHGGALRGTFSWTVDGGSGIDDYFVALSDGGDVVIYAGSNIDVAADWALKGIWYVGGFPAGRRIASTFGGDLLIASLTGIVPLSRMVSGEAGGQFATAQIASLFNQLATERSSLLGWSMHIHPKDNALLVLVPTASGAETEQLAMSLTTRGWSRYRDLPILSAGVHSGEFYFGTDDGKVCQSADYIDAVLLSDSNSYSPVSYSLLTAYTNLGSPRHKQVKHIRPVVLSQSSSPTVEVHARYNFSLEEPDAPSDVVSVDAGNAWDSGIWDTAVWGGTQSASQPMRGGAGMGRDVAIAVRGEATSRTTLVSLDVVFTLGGVLG